MQIMQSRRDFLASAVVGRGRGRAWRSGDRSPTRRRRRRPRSGCARSRASASRLSTSPRSCCAPRASPMSATWQTGQRAGTPREMARGEVDFSLNFAAPLVVPIDAGEPITVLAGVHPGCFELFANERIRSIADLKGKSVGVQGLGLEPAHLPGRSWRPMSGSIPSTTSIGSRARRQAEGAVRRREDRCVPRLSARAQELRARNIGHVILNSAVDRPWSQYFCCMLAGNADFVQSIRSRPSASCAPSSRPPTSASPSRSASRNCWSMAGSRRATTTPSRR